MFPSLWAIFSHLTPPYPRAYPPAIYAAPACSNDAKFWRANQAAYPALPRRFSSRQRPRRWRPLRQSGRRPCVAAPVLVTPRLPFLPTPQSSPRRAAPCGHLIQIDHAVLATSRSSSCGRSSIVPYPFSRLFHSFDRAPVLQFVRRCLAWCSSAVLSLRGCGC